MVSLYDAATAEEKLMKMKKEELKEEARLRRLPVSGNKSDLVKRLIRRCDDDNVTADVPTNNLNQEDRAICEKTVGSLSRRENCQELVKTERSNIVLWKRPFTTLDYGLREFLLVLLNWSKSLRHHKLSFFSFCAVVGIALILRLIDGPHKEFTDDIESYILWCLWWVGLGVLSSVGLGTGLHTFLLYLGPHIAAVTMAAYECGTTDFPSPPYPSSIICPTAVAAGKAVTSVWAIMSKVRVEAFCWGLGTALGELPPYFMARAHRLSGYDPDEDDEDEFEELQKKLEHPESLTSFDRAKLSMEKLVEKVGFMGILACASIPNPLFDLAGITCGHFLVPFWKFFGATVIGKAIIKMHIQKMFVILAFSETLLATFVSHLHNVPWIGQLLEKPLIEFLKKQKEKLHNRDGSGSVSDPGLLGFLFEKLILVMVLYFVISILNSLAQSYHKRITKQKKSYHLHAE